MSELQLKDVLSEIKKQCEVRKVDMAIESNSDSTARVLLTIDSYADSIVYEVNETIKRTGTGRMQINKQRKGNMFILTIPRKFVTKNAIQQVKKVVDYLVENKVNAGYKLLYDLVIVINLEDYIDRILDNIREKYPQFNIDSTKDGTKYIVDISRKVE